MGCGMLSQRRRRLVVIHQHAGPTLEGVLVYRSKDCYRLAFPKLVQMADDERQTVSLDGEVEVPRERVLFLQLLAKAG
jgi:hypothetical protein